jgi:uncharacterized membrane protein YkvA (DUF1232 family)
MTSKAEADPDAVLDPSRALVPSTLRVNERRVRRGFLPKIRAVAAHIPFATDILALWYAAQDPETPSTAKGLMLAGLAYFVLPIDAIPDFIPALGYTDDAAVIAALIALIGRTLKPRHRQAARDFLDRLARES